MKILDLQIRRGQPFGPLTFNALDAAGQPINLTGWSATALVLNSAGDTVADLAPVISGTTITISKTAAQSAGYAQGAHRWSLVLTSPESVIMPVSVSGEAKVSDIFGPTPAQMFTLPVPFTTVAEGGTGATTADAALTMLGGDTQSGSIPAGVVVPYAGATAPTGWLLCFGQSVLRASYAALFSAIGTTFGSANGTHFNLPDLRGRTAAGKDDMGGSAASRLTTAGSATDGATLGAEGGTESITLDATQIPAHTHVLGDWEQSTGFASSTDYALKQHGGGGGLAQSDSVGGGLAHGNVQPTLILNYLIKTYP